MDLKELKDLAKTAQAEHPHWRPGQAAFNVVYRYEPAIADQIRTTTADPFHATSRLPLFWQRVEELLAPRGEGVADARRVADHEKLGPHGCDGRCAGL
jgi:hypothetical protein